MSRLQELQDLGFDESRSVSLPEDEGMDDPPRRLRVGCSQCEATFINSVPCHETGCPNMKTP